jgi:hypothetical protein
MRDDRKERNVNRPPKPHYLQYAALRALYEAFEIQYLRTGPKARKRFNQWRKANGKK